MWSVIGFSPARGDEGCRVPTRREVFGPTLAYSLAGDSFVRTETMRLFGVSRPARFVLGVESPGVAWMMGVEPECPPRAGFDDPALIVARAIAVTPGRFRTLLVLLYPAWALQDGLFGVLALRYDDIRAQEA